MKINLVLWFIISLFTLIYPLLFLLHPWLLYYTCIGNSMIESEPLTDSRSSGVDHFIKYTTHLHRLLTFRQIFHLQDDLHSVMTKNITLVDWQSRAGLGRWETTEWWGWNHMAQSCAATGYWHLHVVQCKNQ